MTHREFLRARRALAAWLLAGMAAFGLAGAGLAQEAPVAPEAPAVEIPAEAVPPVGEAEPFVSPDADRAAPSVAAPPAVAIEHGLQHDLSVWGMFMMADYVVKTVMIGLAVAAAVTWIIWLAKWLQLIGARNRARRTLRAVSRAESLNAAVASLERRKGVGPLMVTMADEEMRVSSDLLAQAPHEGVKERVSSRLSRVEAAAGRKISKGTGVLASIGSVSPFVGLFGTVWGIMNSFIGIAESQTTNLAVVAPGIAEALLATALGLAAAIPAVVIYNSFSRSITGYRQMLADVAAGIERLVSRDLDRLYLAPAPAPAARALAGE